MSDLTQDFNHGIRAAGSSVSQMASTGINAAFLLLDKKESIKIDIQSDPNQKSNFEADVNIAQLMAEEGKSIADIEGFLEAKSESMRQAPNKEAYMHSVLARADMYTVKKKMSEQGITPAIELPKSVEKTPEISL
jgi:hypothetical protein